MGRQSNRHHIRPSTSRRQYVGVVHCVDMIELQEVMRRASNIRKIKGKGPLHDEDGPTIQRECQDYIEYQLAILVPKDEDYELMKKAEQQLTNLYG